jgi:hypothetical protein
MASKNCGRGCVDSVIEKKWCEEVEVVHEKKGREEGERRRGEKKGREEGERRRGEKKGREDWERRRGRVSLISDLRRHRGHEWIFT